MNVALQYIVVELGLHWSCLEMKIKYSVEIDGKKVLYLYPNTEEVILPRFSDLTNYDYPFFKMLNIDSIDVGLMKEHLEDPHSAIDVD